MSPDLRVLRHFQRGGNATAAGAARENSFLFREAPGPDETFFVIHLVDVVQNFHVHRAGEKIFADAFDHVRDRFADLAGFEEFVVKRADGIDADDFDVGIFFFQVFPHAGDGAAGAHAANEMRDLAFSVFPNFRARGAVVRVGIRRILILVGIKRIGNFVRELRRHRIVAARIFGLHGRGAHDHFGAERLQQIDFLARLLVGDREDHLVAAHARHQRQAHAGVARSAFDDRAAGLQFAGALGFVDHRKADAVFHRPAGIHVVGLDPHFGGEFFREFIQANDRRVADGFENVVALHVACSLLLMREWGQSRVEKLTK